MLEKAIERKCCKYFRDRGWITLKMQDTTYAGIPDRLFISPSGRMIFVEFKQEKGRLSLRQKYVIDDLLHKGVECVVARSIDDLMFLIGGKNE